LPCSGCKYAYCMLLIYWSSSDTGASLFTSLCASQSDLSFEYRIPLSKSSISQKRQPHQSKQHRHHRQSLTVKFPLVHFDCALAPAAEGIFAFSFHRFHIVTSACTGAEVDPSLQAPSPPCALCAIVCSAIMPMPFMFRFISRSARFFDSGCSRIL
jgi:hypothetical protein